MLYSAIRRQEEGAEKNVFVGERRKALGKLEDIGPIASAGGTATRPGEYPHDVPLLISPPKDAQNRGGVDKGWC